MQTADLVRADPDWERLRRRIYTQAMHFAGGLVFDFRRMLTQASNAAMAGRLMWQAIRPYEPQVLVGPGFGATPLLYATAMAALHDGVDLPVLMVRDRRKDHNLKKWVEGQRQPAGARAVILDDFMREGSALPVVEEALAADGHELDIRAVALFFDMWQPLGSRQISVGRFPVVSIFQRHDIGLSRDCFDAKPPLMKGAAPDFVAKPLWWRFGLNHSAAYPFKSTPLITDDAVYVADDRSRVWRHNAVDGTVEWQYDSLERPLKGIVQQLQGAEGSLVFGCYDGTVTRLDMQTGEPVWRWRQDSSVHATPVLDLPRRRLFINTEQWNRGKPCGHLYALAWDTGKVLWKHAHPYWPPGSPVYDEASNTVLATCNDGTLVCVDADSGAVQWRAKTKGLVRGRPGLAPGKVIVATEGGHLQCHDIASGEPIWSTRYGKPLMHQFVHAQGGRVFALDGTWHLTAFDTDTGQVAWLARLRSPGCWGPVAFGRYLVVLSRQGHLAVFDPERELKVWEGNIGGAYQQPPAVGHAQGMSLLAAASNTAGLKVFRIHEFYESSSP